MSKPFTNKKTKVPKITEEEYAKYISALKNAESTTRVDHVSKETIEKNQYLQK